MKRQSYIDHNDDDAQIEHLIATARDHIERYCGTKIAPQTIEVKCDGFHDFCRLPFGPVSGVVITYVDAIGEAATLADTVYELRADSLDASIKLKYGESWPAIQRGSRISVGATVGYEVVPASIKHAMLLFIADAFENRENTNIEGWTAMDSLLSNHRIGV